MKKLNPILASAYIMLIASLLLAGCKGEPACPSSSETTRLMLDEYKRILPYTGYDTIRFTTNNNDTLTCIGEGKNTFFESNSVRESNPDCNVYYKTNYEAYEIDFNYFVLQQTSLESKYKITHNDNIFIFYCTDIGKTYTIYYDSLFVNNNHYYKVSEFPAEGNSGKIFINRANGILKIIDQKNNVTWSKL